MLDEQYQLRVPTVRKRVKTMESKLLFLPHVAQKPSTRMGMPLTTADLFKPTQIGCYLLQDVAGQMTALDQEFPRAQAVVHEALPAAESRCEPRLLDIVTGIQ